MKLINCAIIVFCSVVVFTILLILTSELKRKKVEFDKIDDLENNFSKETKCITILMTVIAFLSSMLILFMSTYFVAEYSKPVIITLTVSFLLLIIFLAIFQKTLSSTSKNINLGTVNGMIAAIFLTQIVTVVVLRMIKHYKTTNEAETEATNEAETETETEAELKKIQKVHRPPKINLDEIDIDKLKSNKDYVNDKDDLEQKQQKLENSILIPIQILNYQINEISEKLFPDNSLPNILETYKMKDYFKTQNLQSSQIQLNNQIYPDKTLIEFTDELNNILQDDDLEKKMQAIHEYSKKLFYYTSVINVAKNTVVELLGNSLKSHFPKTKVDELLKYILTQTNDQQFDNFVDSLKIYVLNFHAKENLNKYGKLGSIFDFADN